MRLALNWLGGHTPARQRRQEYGPDLWDSKFSFAFVRNPYDRIVSQYHYRVKTRQDSLHETPLTFEQWVSKYYGPGSEKERADRLFFLTQTEWVYDENGKLLVDYVGRFENLHQDFQHICKRLSKSPPPLPHVNKSSHETYKSYFDDDTYELVTRVFKDDIVNFGYEF